MEYLASTEKFTLVQVMKPRRYVINVTPRPLYHREREPVPMIQVAWCDPESVWTGAENLAPIGIRSPYRPVLYSPLGLHSLPQDETFLA